MHSVKLHSTDMWEGNPTVERKGRGKKNTRDREKKKAGPLAEEKTRTLLKVIGQIVRGKKTHLYQLSKKKKKKVEGLG